MQVMHRSRSSTVSDVTNLSSCFSEFSYGRSRSNTAMSYSHSVDLDDPGPGGDEEQTRPRMYAELERLIEMKRTLTWEEHDLVEIALRLTSPLSSDGDGGNQRLEPASFGGKHDQQEEQIIKTLRQIGFRVHGVSHRAHAIAAEFLFRQRNIGYQSTILNPDIHSKAAVERVLANIDVHNLFIPEAIRRIDQHLEGCNTIRSSTPRASAKGARSTTPRTSARDSSQGPSRGLDRTEIICGWGKNSTGGPKLKNALMEHFQKRAVKYTEPKNRGRLVVHFDHA